MVKSGKKLNQCRPSCCWEYKNEIHMWIILKDQCAFEEVDSEKFSSPVLGSRC